jgi:MFS family permease
VLGASASVSGFVLIGFLCGATIGSLVGTRLVLRLKHYMRVPGVGLIIAIAALAALAVEPAKLSLGEVALLLFVLGCGLGPMYPVSTVVMQNVVKPHQLGTATGTLNFYRTLGGAIVVAVFGAILLGGVSDGSGVATLEKLAAAHGDLAPAFRWVFVAAAIFLGISLLSLLWVEERPLHGPVQAAETAAE